jgi:type II secretory ATPase GspE/PulE/Tfp pilus assembly ATPase PilB-like protein
MLIPYGNPRTEEEREWARKEAIRECRELGSKLLLREFEEWGRQKRGLAKGHATQSAAKQKRAEQIRAEAREVRASDKHASKTELARQISTKLRAQGVRASISTILRHAGDLLAKRKPPDK